MRRRVRVLGEWVSPIVFKIDPVSRVMDFNQVIPGRPQIFYKAKQHYFVKRNK
jgi:hypothetical protein